MTTNYGENPFAPGMSSDAFIPDQLIAGDAKIVTDSAIISGGADLVRGSVLGAYVTAATAAAVAAAGNTGNGVMGAITASGPVMEGVYTLRITKLGANAGDFEVIDPQGDVSGIGSVAAAYNQNGLAFTLADGATDFAVGDSFAITVSGLTTKYKLATAAAVDGSRVPVAILADAAAASGGDVTAGIYLSGEFNQRALTLGAGITAAYAKAALRQVNIYVKASQSAADPT